MGSFFSKPHVMNILTDCSNLSERCIEIIRLKFESILNKERTYILHTSINEILNIYYIKYFIFETYHIYIFLINNNSNEINIILISEHNIILQNYTYDEKKIIVDKVSNMIFLALPPDTVSNNKIPNKFVQCMYILLTNHSILYSKIFNESDDIHLK